MPGTRYVNVRTNNVVEVCQEGPATFTITTVTDDGYGPRRRVPATSFHSHFLADNGEPHSKGYVPVNSLPGDHPHAMKTEVDRMELLELMAGMSDEELAETTLRYQRIMKEAEAIVEQGKKIAKKRRKGQGAGLELHGSAAFVFSRNRRFDSKAAISNLPPERFKQVAVTRADSKLAKAVLTEEEYEKCLADYGYTLTVREATEADRVAALIVEEEVPAVASDEEFDLASVTLLD